jgi:hypothetical protein
LIDFQLKRKDIQMRPQGHKLAGILAVLSPILLVAAAFTPPATAQQLVVNGDIPMPLTLSAAQLAGMPHTAATVLEGTTVVTYQGVSLSDILKMAGVPSGTQIQGRELTSIVIAKGKDGKRAAFALAELDPAIGGSAVIVADQRGGQPITGPQGPLHLVVSTDRGVERYINNVDEIRIIHIPASEGGADANASSGRITSER